ncbi:MAG: GNAT family N-acetyltransferase [Methanobacteriaceae archaeon]|nr:GNAT family N-acetyltransferase [Methanobacteriaceae archaeon]
MAELSFRYAKEEDSELILYFIKEIAKYENMLDEVDATVELIKKNVFENKIAEVLFIQEDNKEVGFALFFHNFSTFTGKAGLYLEDIFIKEEYRHKGYGKATLKKLAKIAIERDCGRFEWVCLDWNEPSIQFYTSLGANAMDEWTIYRLSGEALKKLAED